MNQEIFQIKQYIHYLFVAKSSLGHGVHSPFVYELIEQVFNNEGNYYAFRKIEKQRSKLLKSNKIIEIEDFGAGSSINKDTNRILSSIANTALLGSRHAQLLFRLVNRFQSQNIIELGTSLGITSSYLCNALKKSNVHTFEGSPKIAKQAEQIFKELKLTNIELHLGEFSDTLPQVLAKIDTVDFAFIDGNHRYEPTIKYFEMLLKKANNNSVFVFDDIYWSEGMAQAWKEIIARAEVSVSIDLYRMGIIFFRKESTKENFVVKF